MAAPARTRDAGYQNRSQPPNKSTSKEKKEEDETSTGSDSSDSSDSESDEDSDQKAGPALNQDVEAKSIEQTTPARAEGRVCKFFAKTGRCRNGNKCHYLHEVRLTAICLSDGGLNTLCYSLSQRQRPESRPTRKQPSSGFELATSGTRPSLLAAVSQDLDILPA